jgi:mono/diheme cytochrome c family protein
MKLRQTVIFGAMLACASLFWGQMNQESKPKQQAPAQKTANNANPDRGQQVFEQNCSRCHNPPEGFSPRISNTIAMHMRVRANLSDADEKALRRFLNP